MRHLSYLYIPIAFRLQRKALKEAFASANALSRQNHPNKEKGGTRREKGETRGEYVGTHAQQVGTRKQKGEIHQQQSSGKAACE